MTKQAIMQVAAEAMADIRTVAKWARGEAVKPLTAERIEAAAKKLGLVRGKP